MRFSKLPLACIAVAVVRELFVVAFEEFVPEYQRENTAEQLDSKDINRAYLKKSAKSVRKVDGMVCGHSDYWNPASNRIAGGSTAKQHEFPFLVGLRIKTKEGSFKCGGSIIGRHWVLTAAHCIVKPAVERVEISVAPNVNYMAGQIEIVNTGNLHPYPGYTKSPLNWDFALIRLESGINVTDTRMQPICLPSKCSETCQPGDSMLITGWGTMDKNQTTNVLMEAITELGEESTCKEAAGDKFDTNAQICDAGKERAACKGDSGGPMVCFNNGYFQLDGVVSWGPGGRLCEEVVGFYGKVCAARDWIVETTGIQESVVTEASRLYT